MSENYQPTLQTVRKSVERHFPALWSAVEAGLSTCATLLLKDNSNPVALIYMAAPSSGKTTVVRMFEGVKVDGTDLCYRSDKFTTAAFVSQSAKVSDKELKKVDLLPRIKYKVLLTPELSTVFRGRQDELAERFSTITRILDGQGYTIDSGTHGKRGYVGDYLFAWLGATTPFDPIVWKVMAQLGSRLFFLVLEAATDPSVDDLVTANTQSVARDESISECQAVMHPFLDQLFIKHGGVRGVEWKAEHNSREVLTIIAQCARLLAVLRTPYEKEKPCEPESAHRANAVLYNLARGHALIAGRTYLAMDDVPSIVQVTLSSIVTRRRSVLQLMARHPRNPVTVSQVEKALRVTRHTAESVMEELEALGLMEFQRDGVGKPSRLVIAPEWAWCLTEPFRGFLLGRGDSNGLDTQPAA